MHLVGFIIRVYRFAPLPECQTVLFVRSNTVGNSLSFHICTSTDLVSEYNVLF